MVSLLVSVCENYFKDQPVSQKNLRTILNHTVLEVPGIECSHLEHEEPKSYHIESDLSLHIGNVARLVKLLGWKRGKED